jgi:hypothetical protein
MPLCRRLIVADKILAVAVESGWLLFVLVGPSVAAGPMDWREAFAMR